MPNPLAAPLVAALRKIRRLGATVAAYAEVMKVALHLLHEQHLELVGLRRRIYELVDEIRELRRESRAA